MKKRSSRYEHLLARRPLLVNSVVLRQNPHNAHEWLNRVQLYEGHNDQIYKVGVVNGQFLLKIPGFWLKIKISDQILRFLSQNSDFYSKFVSLLGSNSNF